MKFKFINKKRDNFYYLLHNLAGLEWPWRSRRFIKKQLWEKDLGPLNEKEKEALKIMKEICSKYFPKKYLGKPFFLETEPWKFLKKEISEKELFWLKSVFSTWEEKFKKIYNKDLPNLKNWKKELKLQMKKPKIKETNNFIQTKASTLYNVKPPETVRVYLMLNDADGIGGERGRSLDSKSVMLELSRASTQNQKMNQCLAVLWHEVIQGCYSPFYFLPLLKKVINTERAAMWIEEINIRSLLPIGIWGIKFFDYQLPLTLTPYSFQAVPRVNLNQTTGIINLADEYIKEDKGFDKDYIERLTQILKRNKRWANLLKC